MFRNNTSASTAIESNIVDAAIDWNASFSGPRFVVLVDEIPQIDEMQFERNDSIWYAEKDGLARFFAWSEDADHKGFGGHAFRLPMVDGDEVVLNGPYSSRAGVVNRYGFGPVANGWVTDSRRDLERMYSPDAGIHLTLDAANYAVSLLDEDVGMFEKSEFDPVETYHVPRRM
jgi:hypothetical protein